jgi:hypothetical protein
MKLVDHLGADNRRSLDNIFGDTKFASVDAKGVNNDVGISEDHGHTALHGSTIPRCALCRALPPSVLYQSL